MSDYIHLFETQAAHDAVYNGSEYTEPWVGLVTANGSVSYNSEYNKLKSMPFTIEALGSGNLGWSLGNGDTLSYSKNGGEWQTMDSTTLVPVVQGDKVQFKGEVTQFNDGEEYGYTPHIDYGEEQGNVEFNIMGNIMSLTYGDNFIASSTTISDNRFMFIFNYTRVVSAEHLVLPATTLAGSCYFEMFRGCTSLTTAPVLPATTMTEYCYAKMFRGCTSLTKAPALPAISLVEGCYSSMFQGCTSLTNAPNLPATTLADYCYNDMFHNCTSLASAPELPATTLTDFCYGAMFMGCISLNYVRCLATNISASNCTMDWLKGVAASGTFVKNASMSSWPTGTSGIPSGWTVQDAS